MKDKGIIHEETIIYKNKNSLQKRLLIGTPTRGIVRMEWAQARYGQAIPTNWMVANMNIGFNSAMPIGFLVADAQNIIVHNFIVGGYEWLLFIEDDVILQPDAFLRFNEYIKKGDIPVVSGLYHLKSNPTEPLVYRGRGNGPYTKFSLNSLVWADGVPTGCLLIHSSILKLMYKESKDYVTGNTQLKMVFETPSKVWQDPEKLTWQMASGTSDLYWCDRIMQEDVLKRAGWAGIAKRKWPFLVDTSIKCGHMDLNTGTMYPLGGYKE